MRRSASHVRRAIRVSTRQRHNTVIARSISVARVTDRKSAFPCLSTFTPPKACKATDRRLGSVRGLAVERPPHTVVPMPALSPTMEVGTISSWNIEEGAAFGAGDIICEIETDKATVENEAQDEGVMAKILVPGGSSDVPVGSPIYILVDDIEDAAAFADYTLEEALGGGSTSAAADTSAAAAPAPPAQPAAAAEAVSIDANYTVTNMPALSPTMEMGTVAVWRKQEGDYFQAGDSLCEIETDKATVDLEAQDEGYIARILVQNGSSDVEVGRPICIIVDDEEDIAKVAGYTLDQLLGLGAPLAAASSAASTPAATAEAAPTSAPATMTQSGERIFVSPLAKSMLQQAGFGLDGLRNKGTGPGGRVVAADAEAFIKAGGPAQAVAEAAPVATPQAQAAAPAPVAAEAPVVSTDGSFADTSVSLDQSSMALRLAAAQKDIPHFYVTTDICLDESIKVLATLNATRCDVTQLSMDDFLTLAAIKALKEVPEANSSWLGDRIRQYSFVDVNVLANSNGNTFSPVIKNAHAKGLNELQSESAAIAAKALAGELTTEECKTGTFTIANLGAYGVKHAMPIIHPPQSAMLVVGASEKKVVPSEDPNAELPYQIQSFVDVTLACDHRVVDGAVGAKWVQAFKKCVESPLSLIL